MAEDKRKTKDNYYLGIANEVGTRSTCLLYHVGAIIVQTDEVIATGYNGAPRGEQNCCQMEYCTHRTMGDDCRAVHAEMNAIISAARHQMINSTIYISGVDADTHEFVDSTPCKTCMKMIKNAGIARVVIRTEDGNFKEIDLRKEAVLNFLDI